MSGIVGSKLNIRGSGLVGSLGTDGQHLLSAGDGVTNIFETVSAGGITVADNWRINADMAVDAAETDIDTGEVLGEHKFQSKDFEELMNNNPDLNQYCYDRICEACILKYDSKELGIDDVVETDEIVDEL